MSTKIFGSLIELNSIALYFGEGVAVSRKMWKKLYLIKYQLARAYERIFLACSPTKIGCHLGRFIYNDVLYYADQRYSRYLF